MKDYEKTHKQAVIWAELTERYPISAKEYFYILRLALYYAMKVETNSSYEVVEAMETATAEVYECAIDILNAIYKEK